MEYWILFSKTFYFWHLFENGIFTHRTIAIFVMLEILWLFIQKSYNNLFREYFLGRLNECFISYVRVINSTNLFRAEIVSTPIAILKWSEEKNIYSNYTTEWIFALSNDEGSFLSISFNVMIRKQSFCN